MRILGIDPGSRVTGIAVLEKKDKSVRALYCDVVNLTGIPGPLDRLTRLYSDISKHIDNWKPSDCAIEIPVYGKDPTAMMKLGRAQAAVIMAVLHNNLSLFEYYPKAVKKAITGTGNARKSQVAYMLYKLIDIPEKNLPDDATDALAVAWCHLLRLSDPARNQETGTDQKKSENRNTWSSFVESHPERIRKPE